jgi:hypothetical protein
MMIVIRRSTLTGELHAAKLDITPAQLDDWNNGMAIQQAMPDLNREEREFLITGITDQEWLEAFGPAPEQED